MAIVYPAAAMRVVIGSGYMREDVDTKVHDYMEILGWRRKDNSFVKTGSRTKYYIPRMTYDNAKQFYLYEQKAVMEGKIEAFTEARNMYGYGKDLHLYTLALADKSVELIKKIAELGEYK